MVYSLLLLFISLTGEASVDDAIELYLMGDMNGSIAALEILLDEGNLSLDEEIRAHHRLGAAYYGIGEHARTEEYFYNVLLLDPYYDLGPWENPALRDILDLVRQESMAVVLIQGEPEGALVFMNGEYVGSTPFTQDNLIGGRTYSFAIIAEGFEVDVQSCTTVPGQVHTLEYSMLPVTIESAMANIDNSAYGGSQIDLALGDNTEAEAEYSVLSPENVDIGQDGVSDTDNPSDVHPAERENITADQLTELLLGGVQMTSLGDIGPLAFEETPVEFGSTISQERNPTTFDNTTSRIDTPIEGQARIVFTDVNLEADNLLEASTGSTYSSRSTAEILEVLASKTGAVTFIYNKHLRVDPLLSGTVVIELIIEPSGRVSDVSILESTTLNPAFDLELAAAVQTWRFGGVDSNEGALPVTYPFNFSR